jgi:hypothetical protein
LHRNKGGAQRRIEHFSKPFTRSYVLKPLIVKEVEKMKTSLFIKMKKFAIATRSFERRRKIMKRLTFTLSFPLTAILILLLVVCPVAMAAQDTGSPTHPNHPAAQTAKISDTDAENIVRRSLQYVALYDTLLNFTFNKKNPAPFRGRTTTRSTSSR